MISNFIATHNKFVGIVTATPISTSDSWILASHGAGPQQVCQKEKVCRFS
jgi:hypothetical protein